MGARRTARTMVLLAAALGAAAAHAAREPSLESRVERLEGMLQSQGLVDLLAQVQRLQRDLQQLRGDVEVQGHKLEQLQQRQRDLYVDIDRRLQQLEAGRAGLPADQAAPVVPGAPVAPGPSLNDAAPGMPPVPAGASYDPAAEEKAYDEALTILREGRYPEAAEAYRQFLATYPNGRYADNAQYWLAETHYVTRRFQEGLDEFNKLVTTFPNSPKVPDAQLKIGYIHYELGNWKEARAQLEALVQRYPDSTAARLAGERLQRMTREGR
ncbi:MAG: tol-pal system protein YbgF [Pseudomonadota bacterium]